MDLERAVGPEVVNIGNTEKSPSKLSPRSERAHRQFLSH